MSKAGKYYTISDESIRQRAIMYDFHIDRVMTTNRGEKYITGLKLTVTLYTDDGIYIRENITATFTYYADFDFEVINDSALEKITEVLDDKRIEEKMTWALQDWIHKYHDDIYEAAGCEL